MSIKSKYKTLPLFLFELSIFLTSNDDILNLMKTHLTLHFHTMKKDLLRSLSQLGKKGDFVRLTFDQWPKLITYGASKLRANTRARPIVVLHHNSTQNDETLE